ncbi:MAG: methylenetetrahydrofolate--tRNA-(uracil(54)-C(5))-methyltransferase (FADH(2)-oxidizing) TrmFO [Pseudomonadota bacterium]
MNIAIIGAGLAGCECALKLAENGIATTLFEMKPEQYSPAHSSANLAELVCSNSLRSDDLTSGIGLLKQEMRELGSRIMAAADATRVPAGKALAVDRELFSEHMTKAVEDEQLITLVRQEVPSLDAEVLKGFDIIVVTAGPLASESLGQSILERVGGQLYFYDAIAPIIAAESIDMSIAFWGSRYEQEDAYLVRHPRDPEVPFSNGTPELLDYVDEADRPEIGDYINCPMNKDEYQAFYDALMAAEKVPSHNFEKEIHFEGCMPIEALAERGQRTLVFGPFKPVGFVDPRTGRRPYAVVQLRVENHNKTTFNIVGCQTKLKYAEQDRVFRLIPGLQHAEFVRHGSMHRNTYVNAPKVLAHDLSLVGHPNIFLAGQITGVEGYLESAACGLWLGIALAHRIKHSVDLTPPSDCTALGALLNHLRVPAKNFQPSNVNFGLMPELGLRAKKKERKPIYSARAREAFAAWLEDGQGTLPLEPR